MQVRAFKREIRIDVRLFSGLLRGESVADMPMRRMAGVRGVRKT